MQDITVTIRGRRWQILFTVDLPRNVDGLCDPPDTPRRSIRIRKTLKGERLLEVLLHEIEHAAHWTQAEESVAEIAEEKARILTRLGIRFCECPPNTTKPAKSKTP